MATGFIPFLGNPKYLIYHLDSANGLTLTVSLGAADNIVSMILCISGVGSEHNSMFYLAGYGMANTNYKTVTNIQTAAYVTVAATNTGFTIQNTSSNHGCWAYILVMESKQNNLTITQSA